RSITATTCSLRTATPCSSASPLASRRPSPSRPLTGRTGMRSILVTGVQGVGKTTVATRAAEIIGVGCWDYADMMMRVDQSILSKDDLRFIQWNHRQAVYEKVDVLLRELFWPGDGTSTVVLLENHLSVVDAEGIRTFPHEPMQLYNPLGLVVIEGDPTTVVR